MNVPVEFLIGGLILLVAVGLVFAAFARRAGRVDLDGSEGGVEKPDWVRSTVPGETIAELKRDREPYRMYDQDPGERLASPFAEQIEDMIRSLMKQDPALAAVDLDLGSADDGSLQIWIDGELFTSVEAISDTRIREVFIKAIASWDSR